jgi:ketosteroid isomerase-like protein
VPQSNLETLRRGYSAFARGDPSGLADLVSEEVDWGTTGTFPGTAPSYQGIGAMEEWMGAILSAWEKFEIQVEEVLYERGDVLVVTEHFEARGLESGVEVDMRTYSAYWFEGGKIVKRRASVEREAALEAAGVQPG